MVDELAKVHPHLQLVGKLIEQNVNSVIHGIGLNPIA
jgi:hypothetical protein